MWWCPEQLYGLNEVLNWNVGLVLKNAKILFDSWILFWFEFAVSLGALLGSFLILPKSFSRLRFSFFWFVGYFS